MGLSTHHFTPKKQEAIVVIKEPRLCSLFLLCCCCWLSSNSTIGCLTSTKGGGKSHGKLSSSRPGYLLSFSLLRLFGGSTDIGKVRNDFLGVFSLSGTRLATGFEDCKNYDLSFVMDWLRKGRFKWRELSHPHRITEFRPDAPQSQMSRLFW